MTETLEILKSTRALLEKGWIKDAWAHDIDGNRVPSRSDDAACFSLRGALNHAMYKLGRPEVDSIHAYEAIRIAILETGGRDRDMATHLWADTHDRAWSEVLAVFDLAIANEDARS